MSDTNDDHRNDESGSNGGNDPLSAPNNPLSSTIGAVIHHFSQSRVRAQEHIEATARVVNLEDQIAAQDMYIQELLGQLTQAYTPTPVVPDNSAQTSSASIPTRQPDLSQLNSSTNPRPSHQPYHSSPTVTPEPQPQHCAPLDHSESTSQLQVPALSLALQPNTSPVPRTIHVSAPPSSSESGTRFGSEESQELWYACAHLDENWDRDAYGQLTRNGKAKRIVIADCLGMEVEFSSVGGCSFTPIPDALGSKAWIDHFHDGYTPLLLATSRKSMEVAYALVSMGADIYTCCSGATMEYGQNALELCPTVAESKALHMEHLKYRFELDRILRRVFHRPPAAHTNDTKAATHIGFFDTNRSGPGSLIDRITKFMFSPKNSALRPNVLSSAVLSRLPSSPIMLAKLEAWLEHILPPDLSNDAKAGSLPRYLGHLQLTMKNISDTWARYAVLQDKDERLAFVSSATATTTAATELSVDSDTSDGDEEVKTEFGAYETKSPESITEHPSSPQETSPSSAKLSPTTESQNFTFSPQSDPIIASSFVNQHSRLSALMSELEPVRSYSELRSYLLSIQRKLYIRHNHMFLRKLRLESAAAINDSEREVISERLQQTPDVSHESLMTDLLSRYDKLSDAELAVELGVTKKHFLVTYRDGVRAPRRPHGALSLRGLWQLAVDLRLLLAWYPVIQAKDKGIRRFLSLASIRSSEFNDTFQPEEVATFPISCQPIPKAPPRHHFDAAQDPNLPGGPIYYNEFGNAFASTSPLAPMFTAVVQAAEQACQTYGVKATMYMLLPEEVDMFEANMRQGPASQLDSLSIIMDIFLALDNDIDGFITRTNFEHGWNYFAVGNVRTREAVGRYGDSWPSLFAAAQQSETDENKHCVVG